MIYSKSRDYNDEIKSRIASGRWVFESNSGRKHPFLIHLASRQKVTIPFSPKDSGRGLKNFKSQLNKIDSNTLIKQ